MRRRPDLKPAENGAIRVPEDERVQVELEQLDYVRGTMERLAADMNGHVHGAGQAGASWAPAGATAGYGACTSAPITAELLVRCLE